ncbi:MAG: GNAT family N-acetyltransferase [Ruminococcaceae bacterium]|nr:GNAT family N-acetyltransferase [Oscillospiraceae bacterium]
MQQLKMLRMDAPVRVRPLPEGYRYEYFTGSTEEIWDWIIICRHGLLPPDAGEDCFKSTILEYPDLVPEKDLFFVVDLNGCRVATSASVCHQNKEGYLHMVAALPGYRGQGIGHAMLSHALCMMEERGCTHAVLTTDDFRLPAIKTYLDAGFRPVLYHDPDSDMRARWDGVIAALGYEPVAYISEI